MSRRESFMVRGLLKPKQTPQAKAMAVEQAKKGVTDLTKRVKQYMREAVAAEDSM